MDVCITCIQSKELFNSNEFCLSALKDVCCILCHPQSHDCHVIHALSDVHDLLGLAKAQLKSFTKGEYQYCLVAELGDVYRGTFQQNALDQN